MFESYRVIHFVGIGGIGMSGIAELLHNLGYEVTGSDIKESRTTKRLRGLGMAVHIGHRVENINGAHVVVISSAVKEDNPEVVAAKQRQVPVIPRAEMLAELCRLKYSILIAGAHGKTTTTSLVSEILTSAKMDPTVVIGGRLKATGANAMLGKGEFIVAEADESDGSFLKLSPSIAVATNIDVEHMDYFGTIEKLKDAFVSFLDKVPFYGTSIVCIENQYIRDILPFLKRRYITYGFTPEADIYAYSVSQKEFRMEFGVVSRGKDMGIFSVPVIGSHNVLNTVAAIVAGMELKIPVETIRNGLSLFGGIQRRFEYKGEVRGVKVFDDYGHHPTEIKAVLQAARAAVEKKIFVVFQPHRYTRTCHLMDEFSSSFGDADELFVTDIYPAGEKPIEGITAGTLVEAIKKNKKEVWYESDTRTLIEKIGKKISSGDLLITLGAGNVYKIGERFIKEAGNE
ncbi:MAG TPA: UDP-N-acetylmuramate--L-alanine ligase [Nitrospirae bacterium]|nr:UDP-N-acetylmuramate--L-alanine ligase [Nitrospirota bacterium]HDO21856.1 UDP-N-acetylmuramate--L-alanine ligase [Nitrospirota bacterium]HDZ87318.1 UDP-N-acetylmuramate--L-alanine ligase [Nitrospirota bacterium]